MSVIFYIFLCTNANIKSGGWLAMRGQALNGHVTGLGGTLFSATYVAFICMSVLSL